MTFTTYTAASIFTGENWCAKCSHCGRALTKFCDTEEQAEREARSVLADHRCQRASVSPLADQPPKRGTP